MLLEPASVLAKAWEQTERIFTRATWRPRVALVTGAGPIGLFAALLGVQRGLEVHVLDRAATGPKPQLVTDLGATFHTGHVTDIGVTPDVVIECTGHGPLVFELADVVAPDAVICLTGISSGTRTVTVGLDQVNKAMVLETQCSSAQSTPGDAITNSRRCAGESRPRLARAPDHPTGPDERFRRRPAQKR